MVPGNYFSCSTNAPLFNGGEIFHHHPFVFFRGLFFPALAVLVFYQQELELVWVDCFRLLDRSLLDVRAY